jgi:hypothetical protein
MKVIFSTLLVLNWLVYTALAQENKSERPEPPVKVQYLALRPALWEEKALIEEVNEKRNLGGLVFVYFTNTSDKPVGIREWYLNRRESGHFRLAGDVAWDRRYTASLQPGETSVLEICGTSDDFQVGKNASFSIIDNNWSPVCWQPGVFEAEKLRVTSMIMDETLAKITIHIRSFISGETIIKSVSFEGKKTKQLTLTSNEIEGNGHAIATIELGQPFEPGALALVKIETEINGKPQPIYSHRNAYADYFPNGTWGIEENQYTDAKKHHLNTMVRGGISTDKFFSQDYKTTGIKAMPHTGIYPEVDMLRDLENHPAVALWYIHDEPDWLYTPQLLMASNEMTKKYAAKKPTLITLCRNVKFFEFGFIPDIPCHDHYSVTAPTTSKWPYEYGTHLEETGYYTANLKYAAEPKPVWVWSQGVHLWEERPKMPLPTPDELGAQLYFNLSRGAKGNLWFTFMQEAGDKYPATKKALQEYSRLVRLLEKDFLASDPYHGKVTAPEKVDVASLITADKLIVFVTNTNYQISDSAYQWTNAKNVKIRIQVPQWFKANDGFEIVPSTGIAPANFKIQNNSVELTLDELKMGRVFVFSVSKDTHKQFENRFSEILKVEE